MDYLLFTLMAPLAELIGKIEADPANPRHVVTVRGLGYKLQT